MDGAVRPVSLECAKISHKAGFQIEVQSPGQHAAVLVRPVDKFDNKLRCLR